MLTNEQPTRLPIHRALRKISKVQHPEPQSVQTEITSVTLIHNNNIVVVGTHQNRALRLVEFDQLEVIDIRFNTNTKQGWFSAEGYISKTGEQPSTIVTDFNEGRFSDATIHNSPDGNMGSVGGLIGEWIVGPDWNGMTIQLLHCTEFATRVAAQAQFPIQMGIAGDSYNDSDSVQLAMCAGKIGDPYNDLGPYGITPLSDQERVVGFGAQSDPAGQNVESSMGFNVQPIAIGRGNATIELRVSLDNTQYTHVRFSNLPDGATLSRGKSVAQGIVEVDRNDLSGITITPAPDHCSDFVIMVSPADGDCVYPKLAKTINVRKSATPDNRPVRINELAMVSGHYGHLPLHLRPENIIGREHYRLTLDGFPEFVKLSAGQRVGDRWQVRFDQLASLRITAETVKDTTDWLDYYRDYCYKIFNISYSSLADDFATDQSDEGHSNFMFYIFQRKT